MKQAASHDQIMLRVQVTKAARPAGCSRSSSPAGRRRQAARNAHEPLRQDIEQKIKRQQLEPQSAMAAITVATFVSTMGVNSHDIANESSAR